MAWANVLLVIHVFAAVAIVILVLLQQGKGADMGAAFGSGGSQTLFGARGAATFLSRVTGLLAATFFLTSISLAYIYGKGSKPASVTVEPAKIEQPQTQPKVDDVPSVPGQEKTSQDAGVPAVPESDSSGTQPAQGEPK